jgi:hypothetical protein
MIAKSDQVTIRLDADLLELADEVASMTAKLADIDLPSRSSIMRKALQRGLEAMRDDLKAKLAPKAKR